MTEKLFYPLPGGHKKISTRFQELCEVYPLDYLPNIEGHINRAVDIIKNSELEFLGPNRKTALALAACSRKLLRLYPKLPPSQQALAIGAIRYFVMRVDGITDIQQFFGLEDDVLVMNHVLEQLGLDGDFIPAEKYPDE